MENYSTDFQKPSSPVEDVEAYYNQEKQYTKIILTDFLACFVSFLAISMIMTYRIIVEQNKEEDQDKENGEKMESNENDQ